MKEHYLWLLRKLKRNGVIKDWQKLTYTGKIPSYNAIFKSPHWKERAALTIKYKGIFATLIKKYYGGKPEKTTNFSIYVFFNSRHDTDNIVGAEKFFTDTLVGLGYVENDSKQFYRSLVIAPDESLDKNTLEFYLVHHNDERTVSK